MRPSIGSDNDIDKFYDDLFNYQVGVLPIRYLGVPITFAMLKSVDWDFLDAKLIKRLDDWIGYSASLLPY